MIRKPYLPVLLLIILSLIPSSALPVVLRGDYVRLSINHGGTLGTVSPPLGLQWDQSGSSQFSDSPDYIMHGTSWEIFSISFTDELGSHIIANRFPAGDDDLLMITTDTSEGDLLSAISTGSYGDLEIEQLLFFYRNEDIVFIEVTIRNNGTETINDLRYMRAVDADVDAEDHDVTTTYNDVTSSGNLALAAGPFTGYLVGLGSHAEGGYAGVCDFCEDPGEIIEDPYDPDWTFLDWTLGVAFEAGDLAPSEEKTLGFAYLLDDIVYEALLKFQLYGEEDGDGDGFSTYGGDCDDTEASIYPGAGEVEDGLDNNCNGVIDEGTGSYDDDGDGLDEDGGDCDDEDGTVYSGAEELPDMKDNDCDGTVDEGTVLSDDDGDGYTENGGDCDDSGGTVYPYALEYADGADNDCDGVIDEGTSSYDDDGDGYSEDDGDCNDGDPAAYPGAAESEDGIDNDCNGHVDDGTPIFDNDNDGFTENGGDCDDGDDTAYPNAEEVPDGLDNDCDGGVDEGTQIHDDDGDGYSELDGDCNDGNPAIHPHAGEVFDGLDNDCGGVTDDGTEGYDDDGDGFSEILGDCDDEDPSIYPLSPEGVEGRDNDCDGIVDNDTAIHDDDGDGYSEAEGDCDDANPFIYPGAEEVCGGIDEDCDGEERPECDDTGTESSPAGEDGAGEEGGGKGDEGSGCSLSPPALHGGTDGRGRYLLPFFALLALLLSTLTVRGGIRERAGLLTIYLLFLSLSCTGNGDSDGETIEYGTLYLSPEILYFGGVGKGYSKEMTFKVVNDKDPALDPVEIVSIGIEGTGRDSFAILSPEYILLSGGQKMEVGVVFSPLSSGNQEAEAVVTLLDEEGFFEERVIVRGTGGEAGWSIFPPSLHFGIVPAGSERRLEATLYNPGLFSFNIGDISLPEDLTEYFSMELTTGGEEVAFPLILDQNEGLDISVTFSSSGEDEMDGELSIETSGTYPETFTIPISGNVCYDEVLSIDSDGDGISACAGDCDDLDPSTHDGAEEVYDLKDNDCDGVIDEGTSFYDEDGDGYSGDDGDCNDGDPAAYPGAAESEDGIDNDCDGSVDEETSSYDDDGDGYTEDGGDCDDGDPAAYPGAAERADGTDNDCDGSIDEGTEGFDDDGDGFTEEAGDCNDHYTNINPSAAEAADGMDNDCDGTVDEGTDVRDDDGDSFTEIGGDCDDSNPSAYPDAEEVPYDGVDEDCDGSDLTDVDGDGYDATSAGGDDCDDTLSYTYPGAPEIEDGADNDCDGSVDEEVIDPADNDGDGFTELEGDCDDTDPLVFPDAPELVDEKDNDCNGYLENLTLLGEFPEGFEEVIRDAGVWKAEGSSPTLFEGGTLLFESANVPDAILTADGAIYLYFVDSSREVNPDNPSETTLTLATSTDRFETWETTTVYIENGVTQNAVDPDVILLEDGSIRLYYCYNEIVDEENRIFRGTIYSAISEDGINFTQEDGIRLQNYYITDPDVIYVDGIYRMYYSMGSTVLYIESTDGLEFPESGEISSNAGGVTSTIHLEGEGYHQYFCGMEGIQVQTSRDGSLWSIGDTVIYPPDGRTVCDPSLLQMGEDDFIIFYKEMEQWWGG